MADQNQNDQHLLDLPVQDEETRKNILASVPASDATATGKERAAAHDNALDNIPQGEDAGSKVPIAGDIRPDAEGPQAPQGGQAKPAIMTTNGSVPLGMVGSPSGPVPVGSLGLSPAAANKRLEESVKSVGRAAIHGGFERLPRSSIENASAAQLRAAANDRGWDIGPEAGARVTRARFIQKQNDVLGSEEGGDADLGADENSGSLGGADTTGQPATPGA